MDVDADTHCTIQQYLKLIQRRAAGELVTTATWIREQVVTHPEYKYVFLAKYACKTNSLFNCLDMIQWFRTRLITTCLRRWRTSSQVQRRVQSCWARILSPRRESKCLKHWPRPSRAPVSYPVYFFESFVLAHMWFLRFLFCYVLRDTLIDSLQIYFIIHAFFLFLLVSIRPSTYIPLCVMEWIND